MIVFGWANFLEVFFFTGFFFSREKVQTPPPPPPPATPLQNKILLCSLELTSTDLRCVLSQNRACVSLAQFVLCNGDLERGLGQG